MVEGIEQAKLPVGLAEQECAAGEVGFESAAAEGGERGGGVATLVLNSTTTTSWVIAPMKTSENP